ncbi:hypothetical protein NEF87_000053 [Candidatus Lokiarchaeum ossiferum]|uniref:FUZ/MON1/HPS1 first Longin domain-containing protein n=1 Tax=Candidatus Lokiarchaeum ossiferum TaxID=2951803 RepID=A0ABY6HJT6_9ARCH|nr:hypothetical protein NEF87_000053 [Candidatus Lokiarchaeum sp. B-35]
MTSKLMEIWIISNAGAPLLHIKNPAFPNKQSVDPALFSGMITAMEFTANHSLNAIKMHDSKIMIMPKLEKSNEFILVGRTHINNRDKTVRKTLQKIQKTFHTEFGQIIGSWVGDLSIFDYFKDLLMEKYF